ncbi:MAG TPA: PHP domain-containing protein [Myxococcota bacterium]|nr:PHP domain-containing protein [Myxococcota bacterium]
MSERFDFHSHTTVSDGSLSPTELVRRAEKNGVSGFALTDHDAVDGIAEARAEGERLGIEVLGGIELSVNEAEGTRAMHILGLGIDDAHAELRARLVELRHGRIGRAARIVSHLQAAGVAITLAAVEAQAAAGASLGRPHVARALVAAGAVRDSDEAFARWLRRGRPAYEPNPELSAQAAIALVHAAGGVAVLAHPPLSAGIDAPGGVAAFIERLVPFGLDGIEVWHPSHKSTVTRRLRRIAAAHGLLETGGSDFHGDDRPDVELGRGRGGKLRIGRDVRDAFEARWRARREALGLTHSPTGSNLGRPV